MKLFLSILLSVLASTVVAQVPPTNQDAYNYVTKTFYTNGAKFVELGFFPVTNVWSTVQTTYQHFVDPLVFLSLPNLAGDTSFDGTAIALRVRNKQLGPVDGTTGARNFTFEAKAYNANDTFCTTVNYYTAAQLTLFPNFIAWMVMEKGHFGVEGNFFSTNTGTITREDGNDENANNQIKFFTVNGCDWSNPSQSCKWPNTFPVENLLSIAQLQTTRLDRYLLLRGFSIGRRFVNYVIMPHDSLDPANFFIPLPGEEFGFLMFETGMTINCLENLVIESQHRLINYVKLSIPYMNTFTQPPGIFGIVNTLLGRDSVYLRAFNIGVSGADFITQEDKCTDRETEHSTLEETSLLIIGQVENPGNRVCGATFTDENRPTAFPTGSPTESPTQVPTTVEPTAAPSTAVPTAVPSTASPTAVPTTASPSSVPTTSPTADPTTRNPTAFPSRRPSFAFDLTQAPTTADPTVEPSSTPTTADPTVEPSSSPTSGLGSTSGDTYSSEGTVAGSSNGGNCNCGGSNSVNSGNTGGGNSNDGNSNGGNGNDATTGNNGDGNAGGIYGGGSSDHDMSGDSSTGGGDIPDVGGSEAESSSPTRHPTDHPPATAPPSEDNSKGNGNGNKNGNKNGKVKSVDVSASDTESSKSDGSGESIVLFCGIASAVAVVMFGAGYVVGRAGSRGHTRPSVSHVQLEGDETLLMQSSI